MFHKDHYYIESEEDSPLKPVLNHHNYSKAVVIYLMVELILKVIQVYISEYVLLVHEEDILIKMKIYLN